MPARFVSPSLPADTMTWTAAPHTLSPYLLAKQQADKCLQIIAAALQPGMRERDCEQLIRDWLRAHQLFDPARPPRVRFSGPRRGWALRPGGRRYRHGSSFLLRCDATQKGYAAKAFLAGPAEHPGLTALQARLQAFRQQLPEALRQGQNPQQLASQFPGLRQHYRLVPLSEHPPEGNRIADTPLLPGLWQWQLTLKQNGLSGALCDFLLMDDRGPRWLAPEDREHG